MSDIKKIRETVENIIRDKDRKKGNTYINNKYFEFKESHPNLFKMITGKKGFEEMLSKMLDAAEKVENKEMPLEEMDKKVGLELANIYVYPNIDMDKEKQS